jgi:predicted DCC family thiol-disulfide oxidoreductase YuxK
MTPKLTVWYNTKCPVCNAGIEWQRKRLLRAARAGAIEFRDINLEPDALSRFGAGIEDVRRRLHGVDAQGALHVGADCAIAIWLATPGHAWLGRFIGLPGHPSGRADRVRPLRRSALCLEPAQRALVRQEARPRRAPDPRGSLIGGRVGSAAFRFSSTTS